MSDNSIDSDSEDEDEEVEATAPRITYESLTRRSNSRPSQDYYPEPRIKFPDKTKTDGGPSQLQSQAKKSNFPPDFDARFSAMNFSSIDGTHSKQGRSQVNVHNRQVKPEHDASYPPSFNWQQNSSEGSSFSKNLSEILKHQQNNTFVSPVPSQPYRNEFLNAFPQSPPQGLRQSPRNEYTSSTPHGLRQPSRYEFASPTPQGLRQTPRNQYVNDLSNPEGLRQHPRNENVNANQQSPPQGLRQSSRNEYMNGPSQSFSRGPGFPEYTSNKTQGSYLARGGDARRSNQDASQLNFQRGADMPERKYISYNVTFNKLNEWASSTNSTLLIFEINLHLDGLAKLLKQDSVQFDWIHQLIVILKKIISAESQKVSLHYILKCLCESKFLPVHIGRFLQELQQRSHSDAYGCFQKLVDVIEYVMKNLKAFTAHCRQPLQIIFDVGKGMNIFSEGRDLTGRVQRLLHLTDGGDIQQSHQVPVNLETHRFKREKSVPMPDDESPPDEYKEMAIFPETDELTASVEPFLRANKTKGAYRDLTHYLDIHSRLMKEDYLSPIRTGLKNFKSSLQSKESIRENDLRFYYNVKIVKISSESDQGITHFVTFDITLFGEIEWEYSKRLMFGSLLVFSKDNFESTIFATVANRDLEYLQRGVLEVAFQNNLEEVFTSSENDIFIIAETTAYFESYRHVLEGLQEMKEIPLERYIISCKQQIHRPHYLHPDITYDISSIMDKVYDNYPVPVLNDIEWPIANSTILNDSQLDALKLALTKEMAVIQGPPGTGKTYVGLKIMRIILENKVMKRAIGSRGPILVVCFTNHALDQFLEGILEFCPTGIVRVGGRSSSELLENFNLKKLRQNPYLPGKIKSRILENLGLYRRQHKALTKAINRHWQEMLRLETSILSVQDLSEEMSANHWESLTDPRRETHGHAVSAWLKASNANMDKHLNKAAKSHMGKVIAKEGDIQSDSSLNNKKIAVKTDFRTRVKIYRYWVKRYETFIEEEAEKLFADGTAENDRKLQVLFDAKEELRNDILADKILKPYMSENAYESIKGCVELENKAEIEDSSYLRHWLLDRISKTDQLLDAIEQLVVTKPGVKPHGRDRILADSEATVHEERWVVDDSEESEASTDENDDDDEERREGDEDSNGGAVKMSDIKELEESYRQFQTKEIVMLQRAKMLGIDLDTQEESETWQTANAMSYSKVFSLYHNAEAYTDEEASTITDLWSLQLRDRYRLYKCWVLKRKEKLIIRLIDLTSEYKTILQLKKEALSVKDAAILKNARVIGMTTTGAARHRAVLQEVGCRIIVVEEAAEVLEAHIVTTLNSKCQHLILIGDHQQLRPSPTVHKLAVDYDLEISLFERLVKNNIPHVTLTEQHRMRPEISVYLQHIYKTLEDHYTVLRYDDIKGVPYNVFFLQHEYKESEVDDTTSKANKHEARFITGLCKYFLQHEYQPSQITVLAAYSGQVKTIREEMEKEESLYEHLRVTSIDNYQGEENDIILLSLVRSNETNEVGFLKNDNRVCVALSRAKMGLFAIGNFQQLSSKSTLWRNIINTAKENHAYGMGMKVVCVNHHHITYIVNPEDFQKEVPEGGCNKPCRTILSCGHMCTRICHSSDLYHETTKCMQPCLKQCPQGHPCQKDCYQECGQCEVGVTKKIPLCGHDDLVPCHLDVDEVICSRSCGETMICGHICWGTCGVCNNQEKHQLCLEKIDVDWPCGHRSNVECRTDVSEEPCPIKCNDRLECGHKCKGTCGGCFYGRVHRACAEKCKLPLPCGHPCEGPCGVACVPCSLRCPTSCRHSACGKSCCGDLCEPCTENCAMICQHRKCTALCMDECAEPPCSKPCNKPTLCKHKCMSLCGEACVCYQCEKKHFGLIDKSIKKRPQWVVAHEKQDRALKFEIGKDTILMKIPKCKHIFTLNQLDRYVKSFEISDTSFIRCPTCSVPIQGISRYEATNQSLAERRENKKREIIDNAKVSSNKIGLLINSKRCVEHFCVVDEGEFLSRKPDMIDSNHALALTMQMRFAFALYKVHEIHKTFNHEIEFKIRKWKGIVASIQQCMPPQLNTEMTMEFHRLLLCEQITFLNKTLKNMGVPLKDEVKSSLRAILKELIKQQKLNIQDKNRIQPALNNLYDELYRLAPSEEWITEPKNLQDRITSVSRMLDQPLTEDLITILHQNEPEELNALLTRLPEESSDTDETEN